MHTYMCDEVTCVSWWVSSLSISTAAALNERHDQLFLNVNTARHAVGTGISQRVLYSLSPLQRRKPLRARSVMRTCRRYLVPTHRASSQVSSRHSVAYVDGCVIIPTGLLLVTTDRCRCWQVGASGGRGAGVRFSVRDVTDWRPARTVAALSLHAFVAVLGCSLAAQRVDAATVRTAVHHIRLKLNSKQKQFTYT